MYWLKIIKQIDIQNAYLFNLNNGHGHNNSDVRITTIRLTRGKILGDRVRSEDLRDRCGIQDNNEVHKIENKVLEQTRRRNGGE